MHDLLVYHVTRDEDNEVSGGDEEDRNLEIKLSKEVGEPHKDVHFLSSLEDSIQDKKNIARLVSKIFFEKQF